jgi:hypothetical protein
MNWPGEDGTLRDLLRWGILAILEELEVIREQIEMDPPNPDRVDITFQVASLSEGLHELEQRVIKLENHKNTVSWTLGLTAAMSFGLFLAYLIGLVK